MAVIVTATTPGGSASATFTQTAAGPLPIPANLTDTTWVAPAGVYTAPNAKTACHGTVTVDLSACQLVDGGGTAGLLNAATDCVSLTVIGAGAPPGTGRGPLAPAVWSYVTASGTTNAFVNLAAGSAPTVTLVGFTSPALPKLVSGTATNPGAKVVLRGCYVTGGAVSVEVIGTIDVDNSVLRGGGVNSSPMGIHSRQDAAKALLWVPGTYVRVTNSEVTGYVTTGAGFLQGDAILAESSCESVFVDNCLLGHNSDSGALDSKASWGVVQNSTIYSDGGRALSGHVMGNGAGPWNGLRSIGNTIIVSQAALASGGFTEVYQAEGILEAFGDVVTFPSGSRLAVTAWQDVQGSGALGSYPRLGSITTHNVRDANGVLVTGPTVKGDDATHHTTISVLPS